MSKFNKPFNYFVGINSLEEIATRESKVLVMNILGNESKNVTPISHIFSGGNIVAGVQYGRPGKIKTDLGEIPVYSRVAEASKQHFFDTGVIYLPPEAVFHAVTELCHYNAINLKKIVIVTEKLSVKDQRLIRAVAQANQIDVFGANCLGVADSWNRVRIGGALGGDKPDETLIKGSIAIHSNSGNFSTTIAEYLKTTGFGTSTIISSGKDVIIQFAVPEFLYAAQNDVRTKAVVLYIEPGGYYEKQALDLIQTGKLKFDKPIIACITGRWKSNLTRACGHAGALAGSGDDAITKEKWFDDYFETKPFSPENPEDVSTKGIRVVSIQHIPQAVKAVLAKCDKNTDFEPIGNLGLKPWFGNDFEKNLPLKLRIPTTQAIFPYNDEITKVNKELGTTFIKQNMRNKSGASKINDDTQVAELHRKPIVDLIEKSYEINIVFTLFKIFPQKEKEKFVSFILNYFGKPSNFEFEIIKKAYENKATPNQSLISALPISGNLSQNSKIKQNVSDLIEFIGELGIRNVNQEIDFEKAKSAAKEKFIQLTSDENPLTTFLFKMQKSCNLKSTFCSLLVNLAEENQNFMNFDFLTASIIVDLALESLILKRISRKNVIDSIDYFSLIAKTVFLSTINYQSNKKINEILQQTDLDLLTTSFTKVAYYSLFDEEPTSESLIEFSALLALTLTNGAGTISAKGAKESVSARNNLATIYAGYLSNTGLAHGGSGYEAIEYLLKSFEGTEIENPELNENEFSTLEIAKKSAKKFLSYKNAVKFSGEMSYERIPCINHPVFKGKKVNIDPREDYIRKYLEARNIKNVFWNFYHNLVEQLFNIGATKNTYCVNIDAVIAVISLKLMWKSFSNGKLTTENLQDIGFLIFLFGRTVGVSAEIIDHIERGTDMDCRTPQEELQFLS